MKTFLIPPVVGACLVFAALALPTGNASLAAVTPKDRCPGNTDTCTRLYDQWRAQGCNQLVVLFRTRSGELCCGDRLPGRKVTYTQNIMYYYAIQCPGLPVTRAGDASNPNGPALCERTTVTYGADCPLEPPL